MQDASVVRTRAAWLLALTPIILLLTHYAAVLPHEFAHSVTAWIVGIKDQPGNIDWGGTSLLNLLLLIHIDENVDYTAALTAGKAWQVALVAFAGPGLANGGLYLLSRRLIKSPWISGRQVVTYVLFWFLFINLANLYDYIPIRAFASDGDVHHFLLATGISPWVTFAIGGYLVLWSVIDFYRVVLPYSLSASGLLTRASRGAVLILATVLLFGYFAIPGLEEADDVSQFISRSSLLAIPVVIALMWQRTVTVPSPAGSEPEPAGSPSPAPGPV